MNLYLMDSLKYLSINSYLQFISSLKEIDLPVNIDILKEFDLSESLVKRMIRNGENRELLNSDKVPKTNSGQSLQEICEKYSLNVCSELLRNGGYIGN